MKEITTNKNILTENSEILKSYFRDISKYIPEKEQIELARKAKAGDERAKDRLIKSNLRFVITCAKQYTGQGVALIDLIQAGNLGLLQSIENFDPDRGYKFLSFAVWYIRREILREIYNTGRTIRYPITYISKITKVKNAYNDFIVKNQREPTDEELIELTNLSQKQYSSTLLDRSNCISIDTPINDDEGTLEDVIPNNESISVEDVFVKDTISKALSILNPREYKVITEFYGLNGEYDKPIKEIAKEMGLGEERIRQIRKGAIKKLAQKKGKTLKTLL